MHVQVSQGRRLKSGFATLAHARSEVLYSFRPTHFECVFAPLQLNLLALVQQRYSPFEADPALVRGRIGPAYVVPADEADCQVFERAGFPADRLHVSMLWEESARRTGARACEILKGFDVREVQRNGSLDEFVVARHPFWRRVEEKDILDERSAGVLWSISTLAPPPRDQSQGVGSNVVNIRAFRALQR